MTTNTDTVPVPGTRDAGAPILRAEGVTLRFGGLTSLDGVGLTLHRGEVLAVIGPNGAGKTSLFNSLTGVYLPQEGVIEFTPDGPAAGTAVPLVKDGLFNRRSSRKPHLVNRAGISRTFQNIRLFNALTVLENVQIAAETRSASGPIGVMLGLPRNRRNEAAARQHSRDMLEFVELRGKEQNIASSLSYGDQRRLEIARALASDPKVLLLDEPAAGTNPSEKLGLAQLITRINTELGISILLIEHDMRLVMSVAHRITVLNFGKVIASGAPAEVQQNPAVIEAYLGSDAPEVAEAEAAVAEVVGAADAVPAGAATLGDAGGAASAAEAEAEAEPVAEDAVEAPAADAAAESAAEADKEASAAEAAADSAAEAQATSAEAAQLADAESEPAAEPEPAAEAGGDDAAEASAAESSATSAEAAQLADAESEPAAEPEPAAESPADSSAGSSSSSTSGSSSPDRDTTEEGSA